MILDGARIDHHALEIVEVTVIGRLGLGQRRTQRSHCVIATRATVV